MKDCDRPLIGADPKTYRDAIKLVVKQDAAIVECNQRLGVLR